MLIKLYVKALHSKNPNIEIGNVGYINPSYIVHAMDNLTEVQGSEEGQEPQLFNRIVLSKDCEGFNGPNMDFHIANEDFKKLISPD